MAHEVHQTESWRLTLGTIPGYDADGKQQGLSESEFCRTYQLCAEEVYGETGVYISANVSPCRSLYRAEWGCPEGGEPVYMLYGTRNPLFCERDAFFVALRRLVQMLKAQLRQSTAYLEYWPTQFEYFRED